MCLDNIEEIAAAVEAAKKAKDAAEEWEMQIRNQSDNWNGDTNMVLTETECRFIHASRIQAAEAKLRDLGFRGPVAKAAPADAGDAQRTLSSNRTGGDR